jgi:hypothetical protein
VRGADSARIAGSQTKSDEGLDNPSNRPGDDTVQLFTLAFEQPVPFLLATGMAVVMVVIIMRSALTAEGGAGWTRRITGPNAKWLFGLLFIGWAVVFGVGLQFVPHEGANSPYGGLGLIALFTGFFIMMGFLWSVIGE